MTNAQYACEIIIEYYPAYGPTQWRECGNVALHTANGGYGTFYICNSHINKMDRKGRKSVKSVA